MLSNEHVVWGEASPTQMSSSSVMTAEPDQHVVWGEVEKFWDSDGHSSSTGNLQVTLPNGSVIAYRKETSSSLSPIPLTATPERATSSAHRPAGASCSEEQLQRRPAPVLEVPQRATSSTATPVLAAAKPSVDDRIVQALSRVGLWSDGSKHHTQGKCKPCHYIFSTNGCANSDDCEFCHVPHTDSTSKLKPNLAKRLHCKQVCRTVKENFAEDPVTYARAMQMLCTKSIMLRQTLEQDQPALPPSAGEAAPRPQKRIQSL